MGAGGPGKLSSLSHCPEHLMATKSLFSSHVDPETRESSADQKVSPQKASVHRPVQGQALLGQWG